MNQRGATGQSGRSSRRNGPARRVGRGPAWYRDHPPHRGRAADQQLREAFASSTRDGTPSGVLNFYLVMPQDHPTVRKAALIENVLSELRRLPEVRSAGFTYAGPLLALVDTFGVFVPQGRTVDEMRDRPDAAHSRRQPRRICRRMGVRLLAGRWFEARDDASAPPVIIVNRTVMQRFFNNENPVGQMVHLDGRMDLPPQQIVGVVEDMRQGRLDQEPGAATVRRLSPDARVHAGAEAADPCAGAPGVRVLLVRRPHRSRSGDIVARGEIDDRPSRSRGRHRRDAADGGSGQGLADASALLCVASRAFSRSSRRCWGRSASMECWPMPSASARRSSAFAWRWARSRGRFWGS